MQHMKSICFFLIFHLCIHFTLKAQLINDSLIVKKYTITDTVKNHIPFRLTALPSNYYTSKLGFFCKKELQIQKAIKLPVVFRLGSAAYTDKMEGKIRY